MHIVKAPSHLDVWRERVDIVWENHQHNNTTKTNVCSTYMWRVNDVLDESVAIIQRDFSVL